MSIRNIIVDVDGTLLDSKRDIAKAQLWVLEQFGVSGYRTEDLYRAIGRKLEDTFKEFLPVELHERIPEAASMYRDYYRPRAFDSTVLFPEVLSTIEKLKNRDKNLAVATTKSTLTTRRILSHFGIDHYFEQLQGTDGVPYKPDPFIIRKILKDQGWEAERSLMVGDAREDIMAGAAAGARTCGVTYGALSRGEMEAMNPDFLIDRFDGLLGIVL